MGGGRHLYKPRRNKLLIVAIVVVDVARDTARRCRVTNCSHMTLEPITAADDPLVLALHPLADLRREERTRCVRVYARAALNNGPVPNGTRTTKPGVFSKRAWTRL